MKVEGISMKLLIPIATFLLHPRSTFFLLPSNFYLL